MARLIARTCGNRLFRLSLLVLLLFFLFSKKQIYLDMTLQKFETSSECKFPNLKLRSPEIDKYFFNVSIPDCSTKDNFDWVRHDKLKFIINKKAEEAHGQVKCDYTDFRRETDYRVLKKDFQNYPNESDILGDFFIAKCTAADSAKFQKVFATVKPVELPPMVDNPGGLDVNVIILAFDSVSRLTFMRKMPQTYEFLVDSLGAVVLEGYNIVGDGTPQALIPILTGSTEPELPLTRKRFKNAQYVDVYPFVWRNFSDLGWATLYGEDSHKFGVFTYRLKGFKKQPTTHMLSTYYCEAKTLASQCQGTQPTYEIHFDYIKRFFEAYPTKRRKFAFTITDLSHDRLNLVGIADGYMRDFLREFRSKGWLNDTLLVLMSDHGSRFSGLRVTQQGKMEERMPFVSIVVPEKLDEKYPEIRQNLKLNSKRLVTPFDLHSTIASVLRYERTPKEDYSHHRGISLFTEIPKSRTCEQAAIDPHWCVCLNWQQLAVDNKDALRVARAIVDSINELTLAQRQFCSSLSLKSVNTAHRYLPNAQVLKYRGVKDIDGFEPDLAQVASPGQIYYQISITTQPGDSVYEATVSHLLSIDKFVLDTKDVSIITKYANLSSCIVDTFTDLRKFCVCSK